MSRDATYHYQGQKEINLISHLGSKHKASICLTITSEGVCLPPLVVFLYAYLKI